MSLYAQYVKERDGLDAIETEYGFVFWKTAQRPHGKIALLNDFFIVESKRKKGHARALLKTFLSAARDQCCTHIVCNITVNDPGSAYTLSVALKRDFQIIGAENGVITLIWSLENYGKYPKS